MGDLAVLGPMLACALIPLVICTRWVEQGKVGFALTALCIFGAALTVLMYATNHDFGLYPIRAISWALLFALPATLGSGAGTLLGWLIRRRKDRRISK